MGYRPWGCRFGHNWGLGTHVSMWSIFSHLLTGLLFKVSEYGRNWDPCMHLVKHFSNEPWLYACVYQAFFPYMPKTFGSYLYYCTYQIHEFHVYLPAIDWRYMFLQHSHVETYCGDTWGGALGSWLSHEDGVLTNGISVLIKKSPEKSLTFSTIWTHSQKVVTCDKYALRIVHLLAP